MITGNHGNVHHLQAAGQLISSSWDGEFFGENERRARRYKTNIPAVLSRKGCNPIDVVVLDVCSAGCRLGLTGPLSVGSSVKLLVGGAPQLSASVCWSHKEAAGLAFDPPPPLGVFEKLLDY
ncbi:PilZ domain-containing protein [Sphingomonas xinjiangensis]|uniref:PilZ domain-containing protein n=1 Tax=Sphingomonas xinjiangensis TaxID=643568 RepID=UPI003CCE0FB8